MSEDRRRIGAKGEKLAERHLKKDGYRVVAKNYATRRGEIDLIVEKGSWLVFVEVRFRRSDRYGVPAETVGPRKRKRILLAAEEFIALRGHADRWCRFDLVALSEADGDVKIEHIVNAFDRDGKVPGAWSGS